MITLIHITEKQTGKILDYIPLGDFWDDNHHKSLKDTLEFFEFRTFGDKRYSQYLEKMNRIIIPDEDGTFIEFVIFHAIKYRLQNAVVVDVYAPASYLLLKKAKVIKPQRVSEYTASQHLEFALNGTEWRPGIVESGRIRTLDIENHTNPYAYIRQIANEFELEPRFRVETDGNKVIGRYVDLLERVGEWQGREVEFGRDLLGIERKVDDSNVVTALIGLGPEREDGTRLEVFVEDEEALQRWGIPNPQTGELMHLIETYEPESTDQNMSIERLTELTRNELEKRINSVVEYTADVADLEKVPGMEDKKIRFGDTIKIKDTGFNPPLYLEARVHTQDRSLSQPEKKKVILGDFIEYTEEEVHAIWKKLQAEIAKKVSMAEVTEVVYTKTEVDERDDAVREHADNVAENAKREAIQVAAEDASQKAKQAEDSAKEYTDGRLENTVAKDIFESTVTDLLNNIAQKVDNTRFEQVESELRGIAEDLQHEVADHAEALEEHGGKITKLETDVDEVEGKINATISELEALGDTVSRHETQIDANAREIALKADKQELDLLSGTVSDINSELSVMAGKIEAKAERSEVEKLENDVSKISQDVSTLTVDVDGIKTNVSSISQTVSNHGTQISNINSTLTQHANLIASKVDATTYQQDKNGIITRIENAESRITQTENAIQTKVERSEFDSVTNSLGNRISTIEQTADSISLEVSNIKANVYTKSEVDSAIDGIQIGGRNLIRNSDFGNGSDYWEGQFSLTEEGALLQSTVGTSHIIQSTTEIPEGEYVAQIRYKVIEGQAPYLFATNGTDMTILEGSAYFDVADNDWNTHTVRVRVRSKSRFFAIRYASGSPVDHLEGKTIISWVKLEKGNKATDWTPAPEDINERFTDIEGTLVSHNTKIEQNAQQIQLRATKAEVDTLSGRVNQAESQITQLAGQIQLRATKTEVDELTGRVNTVESTVQQTAENVSISFQRLNNIEGILDSAVTTIDSTGITVKDGSFFLEDDNVDTKYSIVPKTNLVVDHSFELLKRIGTISSYGDFDFSGSIDLFGGWRKVGSPRLSSARFTDASYVNQIIFGYQALVVNSSNYVRQAIPYVPGQTYTLSAYYMKSRRNSSGYPRLRVRLEDNSGNIKQTWSKDFPIVSEEKLTRVSLTFTVPTTANPVVGGDVLVIELLTTNSNYLEVDGVQVVLGNYPAIYEPENNVFDLMNGTKGYRINYLEFAQNSYRSNTAGLNMNNSDIYNVNKIEISGENILEFREGTGVQQIRFNTSGDGRIYFGRYGSDDGWALIGNQSRIAIYDYEYGGAFPIVVRRSPKAVEINGSFSVSGTKSAVVDTENYGRRLMYAVEAPDNRFMDVIEGVFETGEYWILLNRMFAETINGYSVFPIPQGKGIAKILKKETDRFKVYVESEEPVEIAFWVYGKRKGYEGIYMEKLTDFEEGIT